MSKIQCCEYDMFERSSYTVWLHVNRFIYCIYLFPANSINPFSFVQILLVCLSYFANVVFLSLYWMCHKHSTMCYGYGKIIIILYIGKNDQKLHVLNYLSLKIDMSWILFLLLKSDPWGDDWIEWQCNPVFVNMCIFVLSIFGLSINKIFAHIFSLSMWFRNPFSICFSN